jgi:hypothetical protein
VEPTALANQIFYNPERVEPFQGSVIFFISFPPVSPEVIEI